MNLLHADSLETSWSDFTGGSTYIFANPPFVKGKHLTADQRVQLKKFKTSSTDSAFLIKACQEHMYGTWIIGYKTGLVRNLDCGVEDLGDHLKDKIASGRLAEKWINTIDGSFEVVKIKQSKFLTDWIDVIRLADFTGTLRSDSYKPGWVECCTVAKKFYVPEDNNQAVDVNPEVDYVLSKTMSLDTGWKLVRPLANKVLDNIVLHNPTEWTEKAVQSKAWCVWCKNTSAHVGDCVVPRMGVSVYTFPLFQGDDLAHYDSMSDDEIFSELLDRYNKLVSK